MEKIKQQFLVLKCPNVEASEELSQIKTLLLQDSIHRNQLIKWIAELMDSSVDELDELGFDFDSIQGWRLSLTLVQSYKDLDEKQYYGSLIHTMDYLLENDLATPSTCVGTEANSTLIPRDILSDVSTRPAKNTANECDLLAMTTTDFQNLKNSLIVDLRNRAYVETTNQSKPIATYEDFAELEESLRKMKQNLEQDFNPWTEASQIKRFGTNSLSSRVGKLHEKEAQISNSLKVDGDQRRCATSISGQF